MVKKILVPIAFSKFSKGILEYAASLAAPLGAQLIIVNVINERDLEAVDRITSYGYQVDGEHYLETIKNERREVFSEISANLSVPDKKISCVFLVGDPATELLNLVIDKEIDMVIMGVKTRDIRHLLTGSVAERMFRKCPCTIVSFRDKEISERLTRRILKHR